jgi:dihydrolipoamide dehydrogenase
MIYDLIIIGGGPGGYHAAERAGHAGLNVLLIEKSSLGGVCLNEGCIPSKSLLYSAKIADNARAGKRFGVVAENVTLDHKTVISRKNRVVKALISGVFMKMKQNNVTVVMGEGMITGRTSDGFFNVKVQDVVYTSRKLLIATGSVSSMPPIPGLDKGYQNGFVLTNREILDIQHVPERLAIIGGGVIGMEMASYFNSAGSKVTVIEMLDHIGGFLDGEISSILYSNYKKKGIDFILSAKVTSIKDGEVTYETGEETKSVQADKVLASIGRKPYVDNVGLETVGVEVHNGRIKTDEFLRTNVPGIYACGDVNGIMMLAHTACREAEVCINHILGKQDKMRYHAIPSVIYTSPEVAFVGDTAESAAEKGLEVETVKLPLAYSGRYVAENVGGDGIVKIITDKREGVVLGVHMIGSYASEIIYGAAIMVENRMRVEDVRQIVFPHPTVCEVIKEAMFEFRDCYSG